MTKISIISDIHIGNIQSNRPAFRTALKKAEKVIILGDIIEGFTKKDKRHSDETILSYDEQIIEAKKDLKPYRNKVIRAFEGNHESTLLSTMGIDAMNLIYREMKIPTSLSELITLDGIDCFFTHGSGAGTTYSGAVNQLIKHGNNHSSEFVFMGHTHKLFDMIIQHDPKPYHIVNTGSFLKQSEYAVRMGYPKPVNGYYILDTITKSLGKVLI